MEDNVDLRYTYELPWKVVNHLLTHEKLKPPVDRRARIRQEGDAFIWEYDVPMYLRFLVPQKVVWKDVVNINSQDSVRTEHGTNVTLSERISLSEISVWSVDEANSNNTVYRKTIELNVDLNWIPKWVKDSVISQFKAGSLQCRQREYAAMQATIEEKGGIEAVLREAEEALQQQQCDNNNNEEEEKKEEVQEDLEQLVVS